MTIKDIPKAFNVDSEEDLRFAVACYFADLGFAVEELSFEDQFRIRLGHNVIVVGDENRSRDSIHGRSDLLLMRDGKPLAVVETKAPDHSLSEEDAWQAISYARLLLNIAPFAIVTNGLETSVYDTYSGSLDSLGNAQDSLWHRNGQNVLAIADDLRYQASQHLVGINAKTMESFCNAQVTLAISDLKGSSEEGSLYIPAVYTPRKQVVKKFEDWLTSNNSCFAIVADSGYGKTNFMCAQAEAMLSKEFVLFYQASHLPSAGLAEAIRNDFIWEFHQEREIAYIVDRLSSLASAHNQHLVVFVDALDEFPGSQEFLRNEIIDFIGKIQNQPIKLCLSCKSYDWAHFVIERGQYFNSFAKAVWPSPRLSGKSIDAHEVGTWLKRFSDAELDRAYDKYRGEFSLTGELEGLIRVECQAPIMLRLVAEAYQLYDSDLPKEITSSEVYRRYWQRRLGLVKNQRVAESILCDTARLTVDSGSRTVSLIKLQESRDWTGIFYETYNDLLRVGFLRETLDNLGVRTIAFSFDRMRSYIYLKKVRCWQSRPSEEVSEEALALISDPLGFETLIFYLTVIDRGQSDLLTKLALCDLFAFVELVNMDLRSPLSQSIEADQIPNALLDRLVQYAEAYSAISRHYFRSLCERIEPYTNHKVGIWVYNNLYQFRAKTSGYPETVVIPSKEIAMELWTGNVSEEVLRDLSPGGMLRMGMAEFYVNLPQEIAWKRLVKQISELFSNRMLDESDTEMLLLERIWDFLVYKPDFWFGRSKEAHIRYWKLLGFDSSDDLVGVSVSKLRNLAYKKMTSYWCQISLSRTPDVS